MRMKECSIEITWKELERFIWEYVEDEYSLYPQDVRINSLHFLPGAKIHIPPFADTPKSDDTVIIVHFEGVKNETSNEGN